MKLTPETNTEELELFFEGPDYPNGADVTLVYKDEDWASKYNPQVHNNCTEVHWRYNKDMAQRFPNTCPVGVALESDIHGTGGTRELHRIAYIEIIPATELHVEH